MRIKPQKELLTSALLLSVNRNVLLNSPFFVVVVVGLIILDKGWLVRLLYRRLEEFVDGGKVLLPLRDSF